MCIYRLPTGNFDQSLKSLDANLKYLYKHNIELLIRGDININYLIDNNHKLHISLLLQSYNMVHTIDIPTRINRTSGTAFDNISLITPGLTPLRYLL